MQVPETSTARLPTSRREALPRTILCLAYGGLLPFIIALVACWFDPLHAGTWHQVSLHYGAVILSFVGALHWGFAMLSPEMDERQRNRSLIWSVMPALLAWLALELGPIAGSAMLAAGLAIHFLQDWRLVRRVHLPSWYLPLRLALSSIAALCLLATALLASR